MTAGAATGAACGESSVRVTLTPLIDGGVFGTVTGRIPGIIGGAPRSPSSIPMNVVPLGCSAATDAKNVNGSVGVSDESACVDVAPRPSA